MYYLFYGKCCFRDKGWMRLVELTLQNATLSGRLEIALFHPLYNVSKHFFCVRADVFEFHPNP
jgi:hypothetical protein